MALEGGIVQRVNESTVLAQIVDRFNALYAGSLNTRLVGGAAEPLYRPAGTDSTYHTIFFTRDYVASALHEIAHWCIAGDVRRQQVDYGYWYAPDGRTSEQQSLFETVEVKPQALEWILSNSCGLEFRLSADNLNAEQGPSDKFRENVCAQARAYCKSELPQNARELIEAFQTDFSNPNTLLPEHYTEEYFL